MIIRKVKNETTAKRMIEIADLMQISADYNYNGRWYVVSFDCADYEFQFLNRRLKKEFQKT